MMGHSWGSTRLIVVCELHLKLGIVSDQMSKASVHLLLQASQALQFLLICSDPLPETQYLAGKVQGHVCKENNPQYHHQEHYLGYSKTYVNLCLCLILLFRECISIQTCLV